MLVLTQMSLGAKSCESENKSFEEFTPKAENSRISASQREELRPSAFLGISSGSKKGFLMWEVPGNAPAPQLFVMWFCSACLAWWLSAELLWCHLAANVLFCCLNSGADPSSTSKTTGLPAPPSVLCECLSPLVPPSSVAMSIGEDHPAELLEISLEFLSFFSFAI